MTRTSMDPDFDVRIADWLEDDPDRAPGPVLPTVVAAFPLITQRRPSRLPWRNVNMTRFALVGAAAAAIGVLLVGGTLFMLGRSDQSVGVPSPTRSAPSSAPSDTAAPAATPTIVDATEFVVPFRMTLDAPIESSQVQTDVVDVKFDGGGMNIFHVEQVGSDPCHSNELQAEPLRTPREFMDWLDTIPKTTTGPVASLSIDGRDALERTVSVGTLDDCFDSGRLHSGIVSQVNSGPGGYFIGAGEQERWVALDANGQLVVFVVWAPEGGTISEAASRAVDTVDFTP